jgi:hypothetical protein
VFGLRSPALTLVSDAPSSALRERLATMLTELIAQGLGPNLPLPTGALARPLKRFLAARTDLELAQMLLVGRRELDQLLALVDPDTQAAAVAGLPQGT